MVASRRVRVYTSRYIPGTRFQGNIKGKNRRRGGCTHVVGGAYAPNAQVDGAGRGA